MDESNKRPAPIERGFTFQELLDALLDLPEDSPKLDELVSVHGLIALMERR